MCASVMVWSGGQAVRFSDVRSWLQASPEALSPSSDPTASPSPSASPSPVASPPPTTSVACEPCAWTGEAVSGVLIALSLVVFLLAALVVGRWGRG